MKCIFVFMCLHDIDGDWEHESTCCVILISDIFFRRKGSIQTERT